MYVVFFFQAEDGIRDHCVTGVQTCALPICSPRTWQRSLYASGTPWNGPRESPAASSASSSRAVARAPSASTVMKLRILASSRAMRSRHSRVTSTGETWRPAIAPPSVVIVQSVTLLPHVGVTLEDDGEPGGLLGQREVSGETLDRGRKVGDVHSFSTTGLAHTRVRAE